MGLDYVISAGKINLTAQLLYSQSNYEPKNNSVWHMEQQKWKLLE